jgi:hypothetical protein
MPPTRDREPSPGHSPQLPEAARSTDLAASASGGPGLPAPTQKDQEWLAPFEADQPLDPLQSLLRDRIRDELLKALAGPSPSKFFEDLRRTDGLNHWFPELGALQGVDHGAKHHPEGDAWVHTMLVLDRARMPDLDCNQVEMLAALGHDFGKGLIKPSFYPKMHGHEDLAEDPIKAFCQRLGLEEAVVDMRLVARHHTDLHTIERLRPVKVLEIALALRATQMGAEGFAKVCQADAQGRGGDLATRPYPQRERFMAAVRALDEVVVNPDEDPDAALARQLGAIAVALGKPYRQRAPEIALPSQVKADLHREYSKRITDLESDLLPGESMDAAFVAEAVLYGAVEGDNCPAVLDYYLEDGRAPVTPEGKEKYQLMEAFVTRLYEGRPPWKWK